MAVGGDPHPFTRRDEILDEPRRGVSLAGAGRPLNNQGRAAHGGHYLRQGLKRVVPRQIRERDVLRQAMQVWALAQDEALEAGRDIARLLPRPSKIKKRLLDRLCGEVLVGQKRDPRREAAA